MIPKDAVVLIASLTVYLGIIFAFIWFIAAGDEWE